MVRLITGSLTAAGKNQRPGAYVKTNTGDERGRAYVPAPLPPNPPLDLRKICKLTKAPSARGRAPGQHDDDPAFEKPHVSKDNHNQ